MDFGIALQYLKQGHKVRRAGWNGKGMWLYYMVPRGFTVNADGTDKEPVPMSPYIVMKPVQETLIPWTASQSDILALDWEVLQ